MKSHQDEDKVSDGYKILKKDFIYESYFILFKRKIIFISGQRYKERFSWHDQQKVDFSACNVW
jgi:hypothetical protein